MRGVEKTLVIGATGYLGAAIARAFVAGGELVHGLARSEQNRTQLVASGVTPVAGALDDLAALGDLASQFEVVILAAAIDFARERDVVAALVDGCAVGGGHFMLTSGTGVLGIESKEGRWSDYAFAEDDPFPFPPMPVRAARFGNEEFVRRSGERVHTTVVRLPLLYGLAGSSQIPSMFESADKTGSVCFLGYGLNLYSNVHVDDAAAVYPLARERGTSGALYHAVAGEANFRSMAEAVAAVVGCEARSVTYEEACTIWHPRMVHAGFAVNSRSVPRRTRADLGWEPRHLDMLEDIRTGSYHDWYQSRAPSS
jgi:nucleoside-diphosphate-sugar epimerase